jgi:transporter family-2 protein
MKTSLLVLSMFLGVVLTVHLAMNGMVGAAINNPRVGNAVFWCIGAVMAVIIGSTGWQSGALAGIGPFTYALLAGQIISAMVLSHYGWLGSPKQPVTPMGIAGAIVLVIGVILTKL